MKRPREQLCCSLLWSRVSGSADQTFQGFSEKMILPDWSLMDVVYFSFLTAPSHFYVLFVELNYKANTPINFLPYLHSVKN